VALNDDDDITSSYALLYFMPKLFFIFSYCLSPLIFRISCVGVTAVLFPNEGIVSLGLPESACIPFKEIFYAIFLDG